LVPSKFENLNFGIGISHWDLELSLSKLISFFRPILLGGHQSLFLSQKQKRPTTITQLFCCALSSGELVQQPLQFTFFSKPSFCLPFSFLFSPLQVIFTPKNPNITKKEYLTHPGCKKIESNSKGKHIYCHFVGTQS
jgi:hypothetical protein